MLHHAKPQVLSLFDALLELVIFEFVAYLHLNSKEKTKEKIKEKGK
jgi:hypothetical protein